MDTTSLGTSLKALFGELTEGADTSGGAFILNSGDAGLLRSLDQLPAEDASHSLHGGATVAAHAQHVRFGLSLFNRWAREGGNPFADARWDDAWKIGAVTVAEWTAIRDGLREESRAWARHLAMPRTANEIEVRGLIASVAHTAYHLGAIRQIAATARGPREGTFIPGNGDSRGSTC